MAQQSEILPLGGDALLLRFSTAFSEPANRAALAFRAAFLKDGTKGVTESATSLTSCLIRFDPTQTSRDTVKEAMLGTLATQDWSDAALPEGRTLWRIPAAFGGEYGPQLSETAELADRSPEEAVKEICATRLRVLAIGFAPGQPYLGFLDDNWDIPRQTQVTPQVPPGAVVVAVRQVIPFSNAAPTGWRQIGRTAFRCYDRDAIDPIPLRPGDEVQFQEITAGDLTSLLKTPQPNGGALREDIS